MHFRPAGRDLPQRCSVKGLTVALLPAHVRVLLGALLALGPDTA